MPQDRDAFSAIVSGALDLSSLLVNIAVKNQQHALRMQAAFIEGRLPTDEEHKQYRDDFKASIDALKETYDKMVG